MLQFFDQGGNGEIAGFCAQLAPGVIAPGVEAAIVSDHQYHSGSGRHRDPFADRFGNRYWRWLGPCGLPDVELVITSNRSAQTVTGGNALPVPDICGSDLARRERGRVIPSVKFPVIAKRQSMMHTAAGVEPASDTLWTRYFSDLLIHRRPPLEKFAIGREHQIVTAAGRNFEPGGYARWFRNDGCSNWST